MATALRLSAFTRDNRGEVIARVRDTFAACGGWITDFHHFSNVSLCINFQIPVLKLADLCIEFRRIGLEITDELQSLPFNPPITTDQSDAAGTLQITFIHDEPDLIIPVPPIPG